MKEDASELNVKKLEIKLPYELRTHKDFKNAKIQVDEDQIHFHVTNLATNLPEIWCYDNERKGWVTVCFMT